jgi:hypothetical protein
VVGLFDSTVSLVDTGFNQYVLISVDLALAAGFEVLDPQIWVSLAAGHRTEVFMCNGAIEWFGMELNLEMLVSLNNVRNRRDGDPEVSVGTALLADCELTIDFPKRTLMIKHAP